MATYLLKAEDDDMARWKKAAKREGSTFASWVRAALDAFGGAHVAVEATTPSPAVPVARVATSKRDEVRTDFKKGKK